jgi:hypothetical protein
VNPFFLLWMSEAPHQKASLAARTRTLFCDAPMPFRPQNGGAYPDRHVLAADVAPGVTGLGASALTLSKDDGRRPAVGQ